MRRRLARCLSAYLKHVMPRYICVSASGVNRKTEERMQLQTRIEKLQRGEGGQKEERQEYVLIRARGNEK